MAPYLSVGADARRVMTHLVLSIQLPQSIKGIRMQLDSGMAHDILVAGIISSSRNHNTVRFGVVQKNTGIHYLPS